jgi:hypothetical protein
MDFPYAGMIEKITMNLEKIQEIIRRKPLFFLLVSLGYLILVSFLKWTIHPTLGTLSFVIGGLIGVYFLDIAEVFFNLNPSPFRSVVFMGAFIGVSLFVVTSSGSPLASGLVLSLYLSLILWQVGEWQIHGSLTTWYRMVAGPVLVQTQKYILYGCIILFFIETFLFARSI